MPNTGDVRYITNSGNLLRSTIGYLPNQYKKVTWSGSGWVDDNGNNVTVNGQGADNNTGDLAPETNTEVSTNIEVKTPVKASEVVNIPTTRKLPTRRFVQKKKEPTPTYTAPDGSVHEGMTQEEFNQRMQDYQMENDAYKRQQDNQLQDLYTRALDKYMKEPDSFTEAQKQALVNTAEKLGHLDSLLPSIVSGENMTNITSSTPTVTTTNTQASNLPTVNQVTNQDNNASNYGGRYAGPDAGSEETRRSQGANNAAGFWL